ncbi:hypothetical protein LC613_20415 [Nostoc sphaeroides CHAB 2801]|uniref:beta strand repeat-containing protein n=1 Tax=Nostoc sphaeroides TaxID=446679 RepID=UPI000E4A04A0|nr:hypothetical protein [Nostoc sphaeroides]MCC5630250.1 hypothetical protein [Nostoc sphaeroides CHAB 2801]
MPRLTIPPNFIGTSGIDTLVAQESNTSVAIGIDILNSGVISTLSGNDSITGTATGTSQFGKAAGTGIGINNSGTLNAGDGSDTIAGTGTGGFSYKLKLITTGINGTGINNTGSLNAGSGGDTITGTGIGGSPNGSITNRNSANGIGISNSGSLNAGSGNDTITGIGTGGSNFSTSGGNAAKYRKDGTGIGISNSGSFDAGDGNDTISGTGTAGAGSKGSADDIIGESGTGTGISNSGSFDAGKGDDTITGKGTGGIGAGGRGSQGRDEAKGSDGSTGIGISNSDTLNAGNGNDTITGNGTGGTGGNGSIYGPILASIGYRSPTGENGDGGAGIGISNSGSFDAGDGNDTIISTGTGGTGGTGGAGIGIRNSSNFDAGNGNDTISGTGTGGAGSKGLAEGTTSDYSIREKSGYGGAGIGISNSDKLNTGKGEDTLIGTGTVGSNGEYTIIPITSPFPIVIKNDTIPTAQSISPSSISSQNKNIEDPTIITRSSKSSIGTTTIGIQNIKKAIITTGENKDTIKGSAKSLQANTLAYGIFNDGIIDTGNDHDILTGQATTTIGGIAYGIYGQGIIKTGNGNDRVSATSKIDKVQQKVTIGGGIRFELGAGNDYFKGFGSAIVDGGKGFDTLDVRAFKRSEVSVSGVISGNSLNPANITFNNNGNLITLSTTGFENFIFADSSFSYTSLT